MPNHVMNKLQFKGDQKRIDEILEKIKVDDIGIGTIDFNKIIPMPECLDVESGSRTIDAISHYMSLIKPFGHCQWHLPEAEFKFGIKIPKITVSEYNNLKDAVIKDQTSIFFTDNLAFHKLDKDLVLAGEKSMGIQPGTVGVVRIGEQNGIVMDMMIVLNLKIIQFIFKQLGILLNLLLINLQKCSMM